MLHSTFIYQYMCIFEAQMWDNYKAVHVTFLRSEFILSLLDKHSQCSCFHFCIVGFQVLVVQYRKPGNFGCGKIWWLMAKMGYFYFGKIYFAETADLCV